MHDLGFHQVSLAGSQLAGSQPAGSQLAGSQPDYLAVRGLNTVVISVSSHHHIWPCIASILAWGLGLGVYKGLNG